MTTTRIRNTTCPDREDLSYLNKTLFLHFVILLHLIDPSEYFIQTSLYGHRVLLVQQAQRNYFVSRYTLVACTDDTQSIDVYRIDIGLLRLGWRNVLLLAGRWGSLTFRMFLRLLLLLLCLLCFFVAPRSASTCSILDLLSISAYDDGCLCSWSSSLDSSRRLFLDSSRRFLIVCGALIKLASLLCCLPILAVSLNQLCLFFSQRSRLQLLFASCRLSSMLLLCRRARRRLLLGHPVALACVGCRKSRKKSRFIDASYNAVIDIDHQEVGGV